MSDSTGFRIGEYEVIESIASHGSHMVFRARHTVPVGDHVVRDPDVQLELYNPIRASSEAFKNFPQTKAALLGTSYPHLSRTLDAFLWQDPEKPDVRIPCVVRQWLDGKTLDVHVAETHEPLPRELLCRVLKRTVDGLAHAQQRGLLPRHVSAANVFLCEDGNVKIVSLGLPAGGDEAGLTYSGSEDSFAYIAPELTGEATHPEPQSLVFSLGVCFYEAMTGYRPFSQLVGAKTKGDCFKGAVTAARQRWASNPPKAYFREETFKDLPAAKAFLAKCLETDMKNRFEDLPSMRKGLQPALEELNPAEKERRLELARKQETKPVEAQPAVAPPSLPPPAPVEPKPTEPEPAAPAAVLSWPGWFSNHRYGALAAVAAILVFALGLGAVLSGLVTDRATTTAALPHETAETTPVEMPAAEPTLFTVRLESGESQTPPVSVEMLNPDSGAWHIAKSPLSLPAGTASFRFIRPDFLPIERALRIEPSPAGMVLTIPRSDEWQEGPGLARLHAIEEAWRANDVAAVTADFIGSDQPSFEWPQHEARYAQLREAWADCVKKTTEPPPREGLTMEARFETPPQGEPPVHVAFRNVTSPKWLPLRGKVEVEPGAYEIRFLRADYRSIPKRVTVEAGGESMVVMGPALGEWTPTRPLLELLELERALDRGDMATLTSRLAKPRPGKFRFASHTARLEHVRDEWYARLMGK